MQPQNHFVSNLTKLAQIYSQNKIAKDTGVSPASVNNYLKGISEPSVNFLIQIKKIFGFGIDDFLFTDLPFSKTEIAKETDLSRFVGTYLVYYYDSTAYQGRVSNYAKNTLNYGVVCNYFGTGAGEKLVSKARFVSNRKLAESMFDELQGLNDADIDAFFDAKDNVYNGKLFENTNQIFIQLKNNNKSDQCFIILNNPPTSKHYIGGLGTVNSVSRGREQMPCIQYILISRAKLAVPDGEIYQLLSLGIADVEVSVETNQLVELFKNLYENKSDFAGNLNEYQKKKIIEDSLKNIVEELIEANAFRFAKVSNMDDDKYYRILKEGLAND